MKSIDEQVLRVTKEIIVKFIEIIKYMMNYYGFSGAGSASTAAPSFLAYLALIIKVSAALRFIFQSDESR